MSILFHEFVQIKMAPFLPVTSVNHLLRTSKQLNHGFEQVLQEGIMQIEGGRLGFLKLVDEFKRLGDATREIQESYITWEIERETWFIDFKVPRYWMNGKCSSNGNRRVCLTWDTGIAGVEIACHDSCAFSEYLRVTEPDGDFDVDEDDEDEQDTNTNSVFWLLEPSETDFVFWRDDPVKSYQGFEFEEFANLWDLIASGNITTLPYDESKIFE
jgi:hypothetical protein